MWHDAHPQGMSFARPSKGHAKGRNDKYDGLDALDPWEALAEVSRRSKTAESFSVNRLTHHAADRAGQRCVSKKEVERVLSLAAANVHGDETVVTAAGTIAVVCDGKVVTVYPGPRPAAASSASPDGTGDAGAAPKRGLGRRGGHSQPRAAASSAASHVDIGNAVAVPKRILNECARDKICSVEAKLSCPGLSTCRIQVPASFAPHDPVLVPLTVSGAPLDTVERELKAALGSWKVVDDVLPSIICGTGGRNIKVLQRLVPRCGIYPANKGSMWRGKPDRRTVLRGTLERMEVAHALIRTLGAHCDIVACPACEESFNGLKKGRGHAAQSHAPDDITDEMMQMAGFDRLVQILSDAATEYA
eukprot:m.404274 g.404274  ORF g.404274 m.404274 type:complete len:361 (-) comp28420_c3_seq1:8059-9141(-)